MKTRIVATLAGLWLLTLNQVFALTYSLRESVNKNTEVKTVSQNGSVLSLQFHLNQFEATALKAGIPYQGFSSLKFENFDLTHKVGNPELPYYSLVIEGHPDQIQMDVTLGERKEFKSLIPGPAQKLPCRCKKDKEKTFEVNWKSYEKDQSRLVRIEYLGDFRGKHFSRVVVNLAEYQKDKGLSVYPDLRVELKGTSDHFVDSNQIFSNISNENKNYLIITLEKFKNSLQRLVDWKESKGFKVDLITLESIGKDFWSVKQYIHENYKAKKWTYALLVGHENSMPTEYVKTSSDPTTPSDLRYFTMGGDGDFIPDVFAGRMVVENTDEVARQIEKIIEYERGDDLPGIDNFIGIASDEGYDPTDEEYMESMAGPLEKEFGLSIHYFFQKNENSNANNINRILNEGAHWLNYIGHGIGDSWPSVHGKEYHSHDIKKLTPGKAKPVIIDVACQNGRFTYEGRLGERFMNEHRNGSPVGAVAYYGGSVDISWHPPAIMAVGLNQILAQKSNRVLGKALLAGQMHLYNNYDERASVRENFIWYHLFGDPSLRLRF